jgi:hypothetical protein
VSVTTGNRQLAARARDLADHAAPGSTERRAAGCAAVALGTTSTTDAARRTLGHLWQADIRTAALAILDQLTNTEE